MRTVFVLGSQDVLICGGPSELTGLADVKTLMGGCVRIGRIDFGSPKRKTGAAEAAPVPHSY
jgi:hypothetical protein